ncbi:hypothetical protein ACHAWF_003599 [Thalassiosira exigua]
MVEVPMYLSLIQKRLLSNYYTNKNSVVADIELVRENCYKYNEDGDGFHVLACEMYDKFKSLVDAIEDRDGQSLMENLTTAYNDNHSPGPANQRPRSAGRISDSSQPNGAAAHRGKDTHKQGYYGVARAQLEEMQGKENSRKVTQNYDESQAKRSRVANEKGGGFRLCQRGQRGWSEK